MSEGHVVIVEDARADARLYQAYLEKAGYQVHTYVEGARALAAVEQNPPGVMLLDLYLPDMTSLDVLRALSQMHTHCHVIVITANEEVRTAVDAMQAGAFDYITKPIPRDRLLVTVANAMAHVKLSDLVSTLVEPQRDHFHGMVGGAPAMQAVYRTIEHAAVSKASVFITGESGTGKELCARALHTAGTRSTKPFVALNCAALPSELLESEIFGHIKGAFTGAYNDRVGAAQRADSGSLFLDEITELDIELQSKLLRFLQTGEVQRLGTNEVSRVDVRFICASNRDPWQAVLDGRLREDLYYRLMVIPVEMPPLRERVDDIVPLAIHFLRRLSAEEGKSFSTFAADAQALLRQYPWPGNVRQLGNTLQRVIVLNSGPVVDAAMLRQMIHVGGPSTIPKTPAAAMQVRLGPSAVATAAFDHGIGHHNGWWAAHHGPGSLTNGLSIDSLPNTVRPLHEVEREVIEHAIALCEGNISRAAELLQINASTIHRKRKSWTHP